MKLYHVSPRKYRQSIRKKGLLPSYASDGLLYFAKDLQTALSYSRMWQDDPQGIYDVYKVDLRGIRRNLRYRKTRQVGGRVKEFYAYPKRVQSCFLKHVGACQFSLQRPDLWAGLRPPAP